MSEINWGPVLPVLSWEDSAIKFDGHMYPPKDDPEYGKDHQHKHELCGHILPCPWNWRGEPCQAYEHWDKLCPDCGSRQYQLHAKLCGEHDWMSNRESHTAENNYGHKPGCPYLIKDWTPKPVSLVKEKP